MQFSLWMFFELLKKYNPKIMIRSEVLQNIVNIRLYAKGITKSENTMYVEKSDTFFDDGDERVVIMHGDNFFILEETEFNRVFNEIIVFWDEMQSWYNRLARMVSEKCLLQDILNEFESYIPFPLMVLDSGQVALAISRKYGLGTMDERWDKMINTGSFGVDVISRYNEKYQEMLWTKDYYAIKNDPFPYPSYNRNIFYNNEFIGFFSLIVNEGELTEAIKAWFSVAYVFVSSWMGMYAEQNDLLIKNAAFRQIIEGNFTDIDRFKATLSTQGWKENDSYKLLVLECVSNILNMHSHIIRIINQKSPYVYAVEYQNRIVVLVNESRLSEKDTDELIRPIMHSTGYYGGRSNSFVSLQDTAHSYMQATLPFSDELPAVGEIVSCQGFMIPYVMEVLSENVRMNIVHPALGILKKYDEDHNEDYYLLLYHFLVFQCNQTRTASSLNMHRTTLIRKLKNIEELTEIDLENANERLHLLISYEYERRNRL